MITFVQVEERRQVYEREVRRGEIYEQLVHEAGFARAAMACTGLLILFIPFRKRQRWGWLALATLLVIYFLPALSIPLLRPFPGWQIFYEGIRTPGLARGAFLNLLSSACMLVGLVLSFPSFFLKRASSVRRA
jgi:hypothetical protein